MLASWHFWTVVRQQGLADSLFGAAKWIKGQIIALLFGSAAVAALISAGMTAWTTHLERKARRAETLLKSAMDLADWRLTLAMKNAENLKTPQTRMLDKVVYTEQYYRLLDHLMNHGRLPDEPHIERE